MIIIAEMNSLIKGVTEAHRKQFGNLTASDKLYLISDSQTAVPMDVLELFMELNTKPQFLKLDLSDEFALGFQYGRLYSLHTEDTIVVISDKKRPLPAREKTIESKKTPAVSTEVKEKPVIKEEPPKQLSLPIEEAPSEKIVTLTAAASIKTKVRMKDLSNASLLAKYPGLEPYRERITKMGEGMLKNAITGASDPDISFRLQLIMYFGPEYGEKIWNILKKDYAKLKELV